MPAQRSLVKIKAGIRGPAGTGKTFSSLLFAYGLTGDWRKICVIDTENGRGNLYAEEKQTDGSYIYREYMIIPLDRDYHPKRYEQAIDLACKNGMEVIIIDSLSHAWSGMGGCLWLADQAERNGTKGPLKWSASTSFEQQLRHKIMSCPAHVICTLRTKNEWQMVYDERRKKEVIQIVGMKEDYKDGIEYEFNIYMNIETGAKCQTIKDNTQLLPKEFVITPEHGQSLKEWCQGSGKKPEPLPQTAPKAAQAPAAQPKAQPQPVQAKPMAAQQGSLPQSANQFPGDDEGERLELIVLIENAMGHIPADYAEKIVKWGYKNQPVERLRETWEKMMEMFELAPF